MTEFDIFPVGDQAVTLSFGNKIDPSIHEKVLSIGNVINEKAFRGLRDVIIAYSSVTVVYDAFEVKRISGAQSAFKFCVGLLTDAATRVSNHKAGSARVVEIPVCYEPPFSPDLNELATTKEITSEDVIRLHTSVLYKVYMIGFLPGFAYMASVDDKIATPRKAQPRNIVEAGSVGIAGIQTGVYPVNSPGGWNIIGRTPLQMFNKDLPSPSLLEPGDTVKFIRIDSIEFQKLQK
jgi:inhibitor of KinA